MDKPTSTDKSPERIWADEVYGRTWEYDYIHGLQVPYIRADLHDAAIKQRDELQAEVERLRAHIVNLRTVWTSGDLQTSDFENVLHRKEGDG